MTNWLFLGGHGHGGHGNRPYYGGYGGFGYPLPIFFPSGGYRRVPVRCQTFDNDGYGYGYRIDGSGYGYGPCYRYGRDFFNSFIWSRWKIWELQL